MGRIGSHRRGWPLLHRRLPIPGSPARCAEFLEQRRRRRRSHRRSRVVADVSRGDPARATRDGRGNLERVFEISHGKAGRVPHAVGRRRRDLHEPQEVEKKGFRGGGPVFGDDEIVEVRDAVPGDESRRLAAFEGV